MMKKSMDPIGFSAEGGGAMGKGVVWRPIDGEAIPPSGSTISGSASPDQAVRERPLPTHNAIQEIK